MKVAALIQEHQNGKGESEPSSKYHVSLRSDGVIDVAGVYEVLQDAPHVEHTTLEVAGDENVLKSYAFLKALGAE